MKNECGSNVDIEFTLFPQFNFCTFFVLVRYAKGLNFREIRRYIVVTLNLFQTCGNCLRH